MHLKIMLTRSRFVTILLMQALAVLLLLFAPAAQAQNVPVFSAQSASGDSLFASFEDGGFAAYGTFAPDSRTNPVAADNPGTVMVWYPEIAAFRAGEFTGPQLSNNNFGPFSFAGGRNTVAGSNYSFSFGSSNNAAARATVAFGEAVQARCSHSMSIGYFNAANADGCPTDEVAFNVGNGDPDSGTRSDALVLDKDGDLMIAGSLTENSDARLKTNVGPLSREGRVLEKLATVTPVRYRFKEGTGHSSGEQIGVLAQEIEAVFPSLVTEGPSGMLSVSYTRLAAVLLEGVNEQQELIEAQKAQLEAFEERAEQQQQQIDALTERIRALEEAN